MDTELEMTGAEFASEQEDSTPWPITKCEHGCYIPSWASDERSPYCTGCFQSIGRIFATMPRVPDAKGYDREKDCADFIEQNMGARISQGREFYDEVTL